MLKKILAWALVVSLTAAAAIGGTLAYLTDRDSEANVFTVGDVKIDLNESFDQGATLIPGVSIEKKPTITNVGPNTAWVWATVAVPAALDKVIDFSGEGNGWGHWTKGPSTTQIDGKDYVLYNILHTNALGANTTTDALFSTVALNKLVDIDPNGDWYTVVNGATTDLGWNNADGNPVIYVSAYAIQNEGFANVNDAYAAYNTQWGAAEVIDTAVELEDALEADAPVILGGDIVLDEPLAVEKEAYIDLNGHTLTANCLDLKEGGTITNGVFYSDKNNSMLPHLKVNGSDSDDVKDVTLENLTVYINHYMNYGEGMTGGSCVELSGVDVIDGSLVLNNCNLNVTVPSNSAFDETFLYGISVNNGTVTMNGGSIVFGGTFGSKIHCNAVVSGMGTSVVNLNNVNIQNGNCYISYGGNLTINTNVSSMETMTPVSFGGGYTLNYNP